MCMWRSRRPRRVIEERDMIEFGVEIDGLKVFICSLSTLNTFSHVLAKLSPGVALPFSFAGQT